MGGRVREPVRRPARADRVPELGQRPAAGGDSTPTASSPRCCSPTPSRRSSTQGNLTALPPTSEDYDRRWAGLQAHNRWLVDFCADAPGRRAGIVQIFLNDLDDACAEIRWRSSEQIHVCGGVLLPAVPPNSHLHELWDPYYEPLWELCEELDVPLQRAQRERAPRLRRARGGPGDHAHRAAVVRAPSAVAPHLRRRARAAPAPARRAHRAGPGLAPARPRHARLVLSPA